MSRKVLSYELSGTVLTVSDGDDVLATFDRSDLPDDMVDKLLDLGHSTKVVNFAAGVKTGTADKVEAMRAGWERLLDGDWEKERAGGGPTVSPAVEALAKLQKVTVGVIQASLREYDAETRKRILANPKVVAMAAEIKAQREKAETVSLDDFAN